MVMNINNIKFCKKKNRNNAGGKKIWSKLPTIVSSKLSNCTQGFSKTLVYCAPRSWGSLP